MKFVIPMAGRGNRFKIAGYTQPKMLIQSFGLTLFEWAMKSLPLELADQIIFMCLEEHLQKYPEIVSLFKKVAADTPFEVFGIPQVTDGQMRTVLIAESLIDDEEDLVIYNIDTFFVSKTLKKRLSSAKKEALDGVLGAFTSTDSKWSFAKIGQNGYIEKTAEKQVISDIALTGLYHFSRGNDFVRAAKTALSKGLKVNNEYYVAPLYNILIAEGKKYVVDMVDSFWCMGTPEDLQNFEAHYKF